MSQRPRKPSGGGGGVLVMFAAVSWGMNGKGGAGLSRRLREARETVKLWGTFKGYQQVQDCQRAGKEREAGLKIGQGLMRAIWAVLRFYLLSTKESWKEFVISTSCFLKKWAEMFSCISVLLYGVL